MTPQQHGPGVEPLSRRDVLDTLTGHGYDRASADAMLAEHYRRTSHAAGISTARWGLDTGDLDAILDQHAWLARGESLDDARQRAGERAQQLDAIAGRDDLPDGYRAWARGSAKVWADRATPSPPYIHPEHDDTAEDVDTADAGSAERDVDGWQMPGWMREQAEVAAAAYAAGTLPEGPHDDPDRLAARIAALRAERPDPAVAQGVTAPACRIAVDDPAAPASAYVAGQRGEQADGDRDGDAVTAARDAVDAVPAIELDEDGAAMDGPCCGVDPDIDAVTDEAGAVAEAGWSR